MLPWSGATLDFCRLFRADAEGWAASPVLWSGVGLRAGYDAMIRLNRERRAVDLYRVCQRRSETGRLAFRVTRSEPGSPWEVVSVHDTWAAAQEARRELMRAREEKDAAERQRLVRLLNRAGVTVRKRLPRLTAKDRAYLDWLARSERAAA